MRSFILLVRFVIRPLAAGLVLALGVAALVHAYVLTAELQWRTASVADISAGLRAGAAYTTHLTVLEYDAGSRELIASVRSAAVGQEIRQRLYFDESTTLSRRDAIVENGVLVGAKPIATAKTDDLRPGTRGYAVISIAGDGRAVVKYLIIGDPFPRP